MFYARWTRKGVPAATSFADRLQPYVAEWASAEHEQNVVIEHRLHAAAAWVAYLQWYLPRTRTRVTYVPLPQHRHLPWTTTGSCRTRPTRCAEPDHQHIGKLRYCNHITFI
jgi:hypothetical protein